MRFCGSLRNIENITIVKGHAQIQKKLPGGGGGVSEGYFKSLPGGGPMHIFSNFTTIAILKEILIFHWEGGGTTPLPLSAHEGCFVYNTITENNFM